MRTLGKPAGIAVFVLDVAKGFAAASWLASLAVRLWGLAAMDPELFRVLLGVTAVVGHNYTCWLRFKGGKGIATSAGVLGALVPGGLAISLGLWAVVTLATRYVSLGSIAASVSLPFTSWATGGSWTVIVATGLMGGMAIFKHRANIRRLMQGTEPRMAWPARHKEGVAP
jgi:glycerol-3-phosphate acyltransferase PlsY